MLRTRCIVVFLSWGIDARHVAAVRATGPAGFCFGLLLPGRRFFARRVWLAGRRQGTPSLPGTTGMHADRRAKIRPATREAQRRASPKRLLQFFQPTDQALADASLRVCEAARSPRLPTHSPSEDRRHACRRFHPGPRRDHAGGGCGHYPLPPPAPTGGPRLHRRRLHHRPAHPALRTDPRRRHDQDPGRTRGDLPDVLPRPGVQPAQALPGRRHGVHRGVPGNRPDDLDRLRDRSLLRVEHHGLAVPRRDPGDLLHHHHRQGARRPEDEERALRPTDLRRADRRGHPRHRHHRPAVGNRRERFRWKPARCSPRSASSACS